MVKERNSWVNVLLVFEQLRRVRESPLPDLAFFGDSSRLMGIDVASLRQHTPGRAISPTAPSVISAQPAMPTCSTLCGREARGLRRWSMHFTRLNLSAIHPGIVPKSSNTIVRHNSSCRSYG